LFLGRTVVSCLLFSCRQTLFVKHFALFALRSAFAMRAAQDMAEKKTFEIQLLGSYNKVPGTHRTTLIGKELTQWPPSAENWPQSYHR
jgi:hypothetical protein